MILLICRWTECDFKTKSTTKKKFKNSHKQKKKVTLFEYQKILCFTHILKQKFPKVFNTRYF